MQTVEMVVQTNIIMSKQVVVWGYTQSRETHLCHRFISKPNMISLTQCKLEVVHECESKMGQECKKKKKKG